MSVNPYISKFGCPGDQDRTQDLIDEAIKFAGVEIKYLPMTRVNENDLWGEDTLHMFQYAIDWEAYIKNVEGFEGEGDIISKFGLEIRDRITFTVSRRRFLQIRTEKLMTEDCYLLVQETANTANPDYEETSFLLESGSANGYALSQGRPLEGDLIYFPLVDKIFVIRFVEHEELFYQFGKLMTYDLVCEMWDYSSERVDTGVTEIDDIEDQFTHDISDTVMIFEDGDTLTLEVGNGGGWLVLEERRIEDTDLSANNELFEVESDPILLGNPNPFV